MTEWRDTSLNPGLALVEAQRCLGCYQAPCTQACPAGMDVPRFVRQVREDDLAGAAETVYAACALAETCGVACPTSNLCEGACVLTEMGQSPIRIGALQAFAAQYAPQNNQSQPISHHSGIRVAVIGAGPSGLGCAAELLALGVPVDLYERTNGAGGTPEQIIPAHRLPPAAIGHDLSRILTGEVRLFPGSAVDPERFERILSEYPAVFLGVGQPEAILPTIPGADLPGVFSAIEVLRKARQGTLADLDLGRRVMVVGAGNVALDAAIVAKRAGAENVTVIYRRSKEEMPGWQSEYLEACQLGVSFLWMRVVEEVVPQAHRTAGVFLSGTRFASTAKPTERRSIEPDPTLSTQFMPCETVIFALGQTSNLQAFPSVGLEFDPQGRLLTNAGTHHTHHPKVFAAGEIVSGGSTIVSSLSDGKAAAREIHAYLVQEGCIHG